MKATPVIEAKFSRSSIRPYFTKLWKDMDENEQKIISKNLKSVSNEVKILGYLPDTDYWWLLTNLRFILFENGQINYYPITDIKKIDLPELSQNEVSKHEYSIIDLILLKKNVTLKLERNTWYSIYNVLKFAIS